jgi:hypothetical protein
LDALKNEFQVEIAAEMAESSAELKSFAITATGTGFAVHRPVMVPVWSAGRMHSLVMEEDFGPQDKGAKSTTKKGMPFLSFRITHEPRIWFICPLNEWDGGGISPTFLYRIIFIGHFGDKVYLISRRLEKNTLID